MNNMHFTIDINAPKQKVWDIMLGDKTYREWTAAFSPANNSYYEGSWEQGSEIRFVGPDENGKLGGMLGKIIENRPYEYISIEYYGQIVGGKEDTTSDDAKAWAGSHENYTFTEKDGVTTLQVDLKDSNMSDEFKKMFEDMWPKGLAKLKEIVER